MLLDRPKPLEFCSSPPPLSRRVWQEIPVPVQLFAMSCLSPMGTQQVPGAPSQKFVDDLGPRSGRKNVCRGSGVSTFPTRGLSFGANTRSCLPETAFWPKDPSSLLLPRRREQRPGSFGPTPRRGPILPRGAKLWSACSSLPLSCPQACLREPGVSTFVRRQGWMERGCGTRISFPLPQRHLRIDVKAFCIQERASPVESWRRAVARGEP